MSEPEPDVSTAGVASIRKTFESRSMNVTKTNKSIGKSSNITNSDMNAILNKNMSQMKNLWQSRVDSTVALKDSQQYEEELREEQRRTVDSQRLAKKLVSEDINSFRRLQLNDENLAKAVSMSINEKEAANDRSLFINANEAEKEESLSQISKISSADVNNISSTDVNKMLFGDVNKMLSAEMSRTPSDDVSRTPSADVSKMPSPDVSRLASCDVSKCPTLGSVIAGSASATRSSRGRKRVEEDYNYIMEQEKSDFLAALKLQEEFDSEWARPSNEALDAPARSRSSIIETDPTSLVAHAITELNSSYAEQDELLARKLQAEMDSEYIDTVESKQMSEDAKLAISLQLEEGEKVPSRSGSGSKSSRRLANLKKRYSSVIDFVKRKSSL